MFCTVAFLVGILVENIFPEYNLTHMEFTPEIPGSDVFRKGRLPQNELLTESDKKTVEQWISDGCKLENFTETRIALEDICKLYFTDWEVDLFREHLAVIKEEAEKPAPNMKRLLLAWTAFLETLRPQKQV